MEKISALGFLLVILCLTTRDLACQGKTLQGDCLTVEREALLDFKNGLKGSNTRLSSWTGGNCCQWEGISCENNTNVVISINLRTSYPQSPFEEIYEKWRLMDLSGEIRPSLLKLKSLRYLDLSGNAFEDILIPEFFGSFKNLQYLNLSNSGFNGVVPPTLGNLSNLQFLDLSNEFTPLLVVKGLEWMTSLVSLKKLKMDWVDFSMVGSQWMEALNRLPFLMELHLQNCRLFGPISSLSSINFTSLSILNIGGNYHLQSKFPIWLLNISSITFIDLSSNDLYGQISPDLGELPNLQHLDLSWNINLTGSCSQLLSGSWKKIEFLDLTYNNFLGTIPASIGKFYNFKHLDVSRNGLTGSLPEFLKGIKNCSSEGVFPELRELHLSQNKLTGRLPDWLSKLEKLTILDLEDNKFQGTIPASFGTLRNLERMSLAQNELNGSLPISFGQLSELVELDVSWNRLTGILSEQHFSKLSKLDDLRMEGNSGLVLNVSSTWIPPFQVHHLRMASCNLGPSFPSWLKFQKNLFDLDMSNASISGSIPNWFWNISSGLKYLNLSSNQLQGPIWLPKQLNMTSLVSIDFSSNLFKGPVPLPNSNCRLLDLSNNTLSGSIPPNIGESNLDLEFLYLSNNQITGNIPKSIGYMSNLQMIDLSRNSLTGSIPSSISNCSCLNALNLGQNNLSGAIPNSFAQLNWLQVLHLNKNMLSGELPLSFQNLSSLEILDLSYNKLSGDIPSWSGTALSSLIILKLRTNSFSGAGGLLFGLSNLTSLQILDLAENNLSGSIPSTLGDLMAMSGKHNIRQKFTRLAKKVGNEEDYFDLDKLIVKAKGQDLEYAKFLYLVVSIDLSSNNFIGEFPKEITKLHGLIFLNLSRNHINGSIPQDISMLHELQSLDLSCNNIYGIIPSSMSSLTFLSYLDLSNNNFSGKIPFTGQMTTFNAFAFGGNPQLCGRPLVAHCQGDDLDQGKGQGQSNVEDENDDGFIDQWFYLSIGLGFAVGILGPFFVLVIKKPWCVAYFNLVDKIVDKSLYVVEKMKKHSR